jgi:hypothetical protein
MDHALAPTNSAMPPISSAFPLHTDPISSHHQITQLFASKQRGRLHYRVSLADSVALGLAQQHNAHLVSSDHHEFDPIDEDGKARFQWIR